MVALPLILLVAGAPDGPALMARYQCRRCHDGAGAAAPLEKHCVRCHSAIQAGTWNAPKEKMDAWRPHLVSFRAVPSLEDLTGFRREWVARFLLRPHDLRPNLRGMMPRLPLTPEEADRIAAHLVKEGPREEAETFTPEEVRKGRALFESKGCRRCHAFGSGRAVAGGRSLSEAQLLAPDLRHTRDRLRRAFVRRYLEDPAQAKRNARMPRFPLTGEERDALVAFVFAARLPPPAVSPMPDRLPVLDRRVTFDEVKREVFAKACQHCHANPEKSFNDGGPGNTGGFGYKGRGLSLASYREVMSGSRDDQGRRRSIFEKDEAGTPRIIRHLLARREEVRGRIVDGVIGMPMALPPLSPEQIQLLESWIAQGRPR